MTLDDLRASLKRSDGDEEARRKIRAAFSNADGDARRLIAEGHVLLDNRPGSALEVGGAPSAMALLRERGRPASAASATAASRPSATPAADPGSRRLLVAATGDCRSDRQRHHFLIQLQSLFFTH